MSWFVYVIKSEKDGRLYKGMSEDVGLRLITHNNGKVSATKAFRPWRLVYSEMCRDSTHAREREKFLKSGIGRQFLKTLRL
jgi:putative endonuclease